MKILATSFLVALMLVPFVGTSAPAGRANAQHPQVLESLRIHEQITGQHVDISHAQLLGDATVALPPEARAVEASLDLASGTFTVRPLSAMPDSHAKSACLVPASSTIGFGYTQPFPPLGIGDFVSGCSFTGVHTGGISSEYLLCVLVGNFCEVFAVGFGGNFEYAYIICTLPGPVVLAGQPTMPPPNGPIIPFPPTASCSAFGFSGGAYDTAASYVGYVFESPVGGTTLGIVN